MTFDYESIRDNVVEPQIANFGRDATLTQPGTPTGDEWDPTPGTPVAYAVKILKTRLSFSDRSGTLVREDDLKFIMSTSSDPAPDLNGTLTIDSTVYQVYKIEPLKPGAIVILWYVYCRK